MNLKQQIYSSLQSPDFPNLKLIYGTDALKIAPEILEELLEEEKEDFQKKLQTQDEEICFDTFQDFSLLDYFFSLLEHYQGVHSDDTIRKIIEEFEPKYIDFGNEIAYSKRYYDMLNTCLGTGKLDKQQTRIITKSLEAFQVRGIDLSEEKQKRLKEISKKLSEISQRFSNNVVDSKKEFEYIITGESFISQMPQDDRDAATNRAKDKGISGYLFDASQGSYMSIMKYCSDSSVRQHFYESRHKFATLGKHNNKPLILETLVLREEKSKLLGFNNYAQLSLKFKMADSPEQIIELFSDISQKAKPKSKTELDEIRNYFKKENLKIWDLGYYANILKKEKYALDDSELKKYFVFENVLEGMFEIINRLYGIEMKKLDIMSYNADVEVYEVSKNGKFLSYFFTDYFYNDLKRPGAWANILRESYTSPVSNAGNQVLETGLRFSKKVTLNVCNFQKATNGQTLMTLGDVETMFHEFGHATHEILSRSEYCELSGFHVEWDFIELPSQLFENWCRDKQGMDLFARHFETGERIPQETFQKLELLEHFGTGEFIISQNTYAMMDMLLHSKQTPKSEQELDNLVNKNYDDNASFPRTQVYSPHTSFTHIFDGGYAAGYYSYMWAEIIEKEVWKVFKDSGDIFSPEIAQKFHDTILSAGTTKKAPELFQDFFGRDVEIDAFLSEKGLV